MPPKLHEPAPPSLHCCRKNIDPWDWEEEEEISETETHLDSEDDRAAVARVLALHGTELADCLVAQAGALKCGHCAALGPEQNRTLEIYYI